MVLHRDQLTYLHEQHGVHKTSSPVYWQHGGAQDSLPDYLAACGAQTNSSPVTEKQGCTQISYQSAEQHGGAQRLVISLLSNMVVHRDQLPKY
jgi:hypothetical protein